MPFQASASNRSQVSYKLEGLYPNNFGVLQGGNGTILAMTAESLNYDIKTTSSKVIRADRMPTDIVQVSAQSAGGVNGEHIYKEYDPFIQGALQGDYIAFGTAGVTAVIASLTATSTTLTAGVAPTGNDAFTVLKKGQWFSINPASGAAQSVKNYLYGRAFRVSPTVAPTATVITLDVSTPFETARGGAVVAGGTLGSSYAWNGVTMKSYSLEVQHLDILQFRQYLGMIVSKMDLKLTVGEIVTMNFEFMGKDFALKQGTGMGTSVPSQVFTPANATKGIFDVFENGASISATTYIKNAEFSIDNTLRGQDAVGVFGNAGVGVGTHKVMGKLEVYFSDHILYDKFLRNQRTSISIPIVDDEGNGYVYFFPSVKYTSAKVPTGGQDQDNMLSMDFEALPEIDAASPWFNKSAVIFRVGK